MEIRRRKGTGASGSRASVSPAIYEEQPEREALLSSHPSFAEEEGGEPASSSSLARASSSRHQQQQQQALLNEARSVALAGCSSSSVALANVVAYLWRQVVECLQSWVFSSMPGLPSQAPELDAHLLEYLDEFKTKIKTPYDRENEQHEAQLLLLWKHSFPSEELDDRVTPQWKKLGFQGKDPATDFRGSGVFGLNNLLYFAATYPPSFRRLLHGRHQKEKYPFAITGMNLTNLLFAILGFGFLPTSIRTDSSSTSTSSLKARRAFAKLLHQAAASQNTEQNTVEEEREKGREKNVGWSFDDEENEESFMNDEKEKEELQEQERMTETNQAFEEVYCLTFYWFDELWQAMDAHYMSFPAVLERTKQKVECELPKYERLEQLVQHNTQLMMNFQSSSEKTNE
ncbi:ELMO domain-containing protein 1 [Balamuthia mandrillaris]